METPDQDYVEWLVSRSMLHNAKEIAQRYMAKGFMWQHPYAATNPRAASSLASVWLTSYPASVITPKGQSVLGTLADDHLWQALAEIGIEALHTGPTKQAGGLYGRTYTRTIDGHFDRIGLEIEPEFGTVDEFMTMSRNAAANGAIIIDDVVPGHTGKGADFRLAELNYGDYPGLYHMVEIAEEDWSLLPPVPEGKDSANLSVRSVELLAEKGYIVGQLSRTIFYEPGVKETDWSATRVVCGVDGIARRWVYLHYFKAGQPTLNWLDPTFAAPRLVMGDALHSLSVLGARMIRLDANGFLGIERRASGPAWSEGHPLSITANQIIAGMVRKAGAFTFQELNLTVDDIAAMSQGGADLSYDFITRPAYHHALVTGDTAFLRLMLHTMRQHGIDPASLIHALQNHDELTLELVHFWTRHKDDHYQLVGREWTGGELREHIRSVMYERLTGDNAPYNLRFVTNGVASTTATVAAAALGIRDLSALTKEEVEKIQRVHLLLAMYNAFQPGVFALSGWDLVGALTLPRAQVAELLEDGDTRWIHRGAYDLMDANPEATASQAGLPKAPALYGSLAAQLQRPDSFARQLQKLLAVRARYGINVSRQVQVPNVFSKSLLVMVHELPDGKGTQVTALNFGASSINEAVQIEGAPSREVFNMLTEQNEGRTTPSGELRIRLAAYDGKSILLH